MLIFGGAGDLRERLLLLNAHRLLPSQAVWLACDLLVAGVETPAVVELAGESREVYVVDAETEAEARERWADGALIVSEASGMGVVSVREDDR